MHLFLKIEDKIIDTYLSLLSRFDPSPFGRELQPYWIRRGEIFSKFGQGIQTDAVGLFSATPEKVARQIAGSIRAKTIVDAFCGIGATAIAFASVCDKVYAVDVDSGRLDMAKNNAVIYGAEKKIEFLNKDVFEVLQNVKAEAVFLDPPWGGVDYLRLDDFRLKDFSPDGKTLLEQAFKYFPKVILRVPRQFDFAELKQYSRPFSVQDNYIRSKLYSRTVYFS